jgi:hypothetical protein
METEPAKRPKRMSCVKCPRYNKVESRCMEGKANPRRKSDSLLVAEMLGVQALCHYNPYREPLALRMYFPADPFTVQASARYRSRRRPFAYLSGAGPEAEALIPTQAGRETE